MYSIYNNPLKIMSSDGRSIDSSKSKNFWKNRTLKDFNNVGEWTAVSNSDRLSPAYGIFQALTEQNSMVFISNNLALSDRNLLFNALSKFKPLKTPLLGFVTSGSTGKPKIVFHSPENLFLSSQAILNAYPNLLNRNYHHLFPSAYMAGILNLIILPWLASSEIFIDQEFNFSTPFVVGQQSKFFKTDFAWLAPIMMSTLISASNRPNFVKPNWDFVLSATGPLNTEIRNKFTYLFDIPVLNTYGSTELLFISGENKMEDEVTCGQFFETSISNNSTNNRELDTLKIASETKMLFSLAYNTEENEYQLYPAKDHYFDTHDFFDFTNNNLKIVGRNDDIIVLGGLNVSLALIENVANSFPQIIGSCAGAIYGGSSQDLTLWIEISEQKSDFNIEEFREYLNNKLNLISRPRNIIITKLPRTLTGKINRTLIRNHGLT